MIDQTFPLDSRPLLPLRVKFIRPIKRFYEQLHARVLSHPRVFDIAKRRVLADAHATLKRKIHAAWALTLPSDVYPADEYEVRAAVEYVSERDLLAAGARRGDILGYLRVCVDRVDPKSLLLLTCEHGGDASGGSILPRGKYRPGVDGLLIDRVAWAGRATHPDVVCGSLPAQDFDPPVGTLEVGIERITPCMFRFTLAVCVASVSPPRVGYDDRRLISQERVPKKRRALCTRSLRLNFG